MSRTYSSDLLQVREGNLATVADPEPNTGIVLRAQFSISACVIGGVRFDKAPSPETGEGFDDTETQEILADEDLMQQLAEAEDDVAAGRMVDGSELRRSRCTGTSGRDPRPNSTGP